MRKLLAALILISSVSVGCAGAKTAELENSLAACETEKSALSTRVGELESENAELKKIADAAKAQADARAKNLADLREKLKGLIEAGTLTVEIRNGMIVLQLPNEILFASGSAKISDKGRETLKTVAGALETIRDRRLLIAGHTDNMPIKEKSKKFSSNWDLSAARALAAHTMLTSSGLREENTAVVGFGASDPVADNGTDEGKATNRRTEIMLLPDFSVLIPEVQAAMEAQPSEEEATDDAAES